MKSKSKAPDISVENKERKLKESREGGVQTISNTQIITILNVDTDKTMCIRIPNILGIKNR